MGNANVSDEVLMTGAEVLNNSRALTYQSTNQADDVPLTPNNFLIGQVGGDFAAHTVDETDYNPRKRWRQVQKLVRHFLESMAEEMSTRFECTKWVASPTKRFSNR